MAYVILGIICIAVFFFFGFRPFISVGLSMLIGWWLCDIDPEKSYTWYSGIWHGLFFVPNLIRSIFGDALYKANNYTSAYNVWWWIMTIWSSAGFLFGGRRNKDN